MQPMRRKSKIIKSVPGIVTSKNGNWFGTLFRQKQLVPVSKGILRKRQVLAMMATGELKLGLSVNRITTELSTNTESLLLASRASRSV